MELVLTYDELAERLATTRNAARVMTQRYRWKRSMGNDGRARVHVPAEALEARQAVQERRSKPDPEADYLARIAALEGQHAARMAEWDARIAKLAADRDAEIRQFVAAKEAEVARLLAAKDAELERLIAIKEAEIARLRDEAQVARLEADAARQEARELYRERATAAAEIGRLEAENDALRLELAAARRRWWHRLVGR